MGAPRGGMSQPGAHHVGQSAEEKAFDFHDQALRHGEQPDVEAPVEERRDEEAWHVRMIKEILAKRPPSASIDLEGEDACEGKLYAHRDGRDS